MDYVFIQGENEITITSEANEDISERKNLLAYYQSLLSKNDKVLNAEQEQALKKMVANMTESAATQKMTATQKRMQAYVNLLERMKEEKETAEALMEVVDVSANDPDFDSVEVRGNKFLFEKNSGIDVSKYYERFSDLGDRYQGQTWTIYENDEGQLVIY